MKRMIIAGCLLGLCMIATQLVFGQDGIWLGGQQPGFRSNPGDLMPVLQGSADAVHGAASEERLQDAARANADRIQDLNREYRDATEAQKKEVEYQLRAGSVRGEDARIHNLVSQYRAASDEQKQLITDELRTLLSEQFQQRQETRAQEIARLELEVKRLRELHEKRNEQSERIIVDRLSQMLREAEGLGWGGPSSTSRGLKP